VRGKNIVWLSMIAMICSLLMVNVGIAPVSTAKLKVDPPTVTGQPPGEFTIDINVVDVDDLYGFGIIVDFAPYGSVLVVSSVTEGPFLKQGGNTFFTYDFNPFKGTVNVGCTLLGADGGVSGEGTLFSIKFLIAEVGESQLDLIYTALLNGGMQQIKHNVFNGYYYGPTVDLVRMQILPGRDLTAGQTAVFNSKIKNFDDDLTMRAKVRFDLVRDDGLRLTLWAGQSYVSEVRPPVYLYVNEYNEWLEWDWDFYGTSPYLDATGDGSYIESSVYDALSSLYGFEDLTLNPGDVIGRVVLEGYTQYPGGSDDDMDMDMLGGIGAGYPWLGSLWGTADYGWHTPRWIGADVSDVIPDLLGMDATNLNNFEAIATYWTVDGLSHGPMRLDALRLRIEFTGLFPIEVAVYELEPHEVLELDPATWALLPGDVGRYEVTATCYYTYMDYTWIQGSKVQTRVFRVSEG